jgi:hypothetical protein
VSEEQRLVVGSPPAATRPAAPGLHLAKIERVGQRAPHQQS